MRRSMPWPRPVLRSVVMASVAMERLTSVIRFSMSRLQAATAAGKVMATRFSVRTAAKRSVALGDDRKSCSTVMDGASSRLVTPGREQMVRAASYTTISDLWRSEASRKSKKARLSPAGSSAITWAQKRTSRQAAYGERTDELDLVRLLASLVSARRSRFLISCRRPSAWYWTMGERDDRACCTSLTQRLTISGATWLRCTPAMRAADWTYGSLSTMDCLRYRSTCCSMDASAMRVSTRMELARYESTVDVISLVSDAITIIT
mmetsp:Transcript_3997/g.13008  ORF Transcript_3997/g.13008 Transcript_3997/m.13008 type:complete len:263 (+) Transcript_3997:962-1750(+)